MLATVRGKQQPQEFSPVLPRSLVSLKYELMFLEYNLVPGYKHSSNSSPYYTLYWAGWYTVYKYFKTARTEGLTGT